MKEALEKRITELKEIIEYPYSGESLVEESKEKLEIIETLYYAMY